MGMSAALTIVVGTPHAPSITMCFSCGYSPNGVPLPWVWLSSMDSRQGIPAHTNGVTPHEGCSSYAIWL